MKHLTFIPLTIILLITIFTLTGVYAGGPIQLKGYLKDKAKNRVFTFSFNSNVTKQDILKKVDRLPNTPGRVTAAYYYQEGKKIPADGITLSGSLYRANNILYDVPGLSAWSYAFMTDLRGRQSFVDCTKNQNDPLCRQKE